jgi:hypothetical protein
MKNDTNFDFLNLPTHIIDELENPDWNTSRRYNWKYHVDFRFIDRWEFLTYHENQIVAYFANQQAAREQSKAFDF